MFCGIGGFRLGFERANEKRNNSWYPGLGNSERQRELLPEGSGGRQQQDFRCVWANDWIYAGCEWNGKAFRYKGEKHLSGRIYHQHWADGTYHDQDIHTVDVDALPDIELLTAGFPCQSFSLAGKRLGFEDTRGTLFYEVARVAKAKRPRILLLENVKGLLSNDEGRTFATILRTLDELGYDVEWQVLNSKYFGVPQNRERVFIVGHSREGGTQQIFPVGQAGELPDGTCRKAQEEGSRLRIANSLGVGGSLKERNLIANTVNRRYGKDGKENLLQIYDGHHGRYTEKMGTLTGRENRQGTNWLVQVQPLTYLDRNQKNFPTDCMLCVDGRQTTGLREGQRIRRLTPLECERLQAFPDGWTAGVSDSQRYKLLGNAVTVNVIEFLAGKLTF